MPKRILNCFPSSNRLAGIDVCVPLLQLDQHALQIHYQLTADLASIQIPSQQPPLATDGLWQATCFELFIGVSTQNAYHEFNFSPSGQWAAYAFSDYRQRQDWTSPSPPVIETHITHRELLLSVSIPLENLPANPEHLPFEVGLSTVLKSLTGQCSYWALHHPAAQADFHDRAGFTVTLSPTNSLN